MGTAPDSGDHGRSPTRRTRRSSPCRTTRNSNTTPRRARPWIKARPGRRAAANLLVGVTVVVLLIALAVVVMLA